MNTKETLFEIYYNDNSPKSLYNTLKLIGITEKSKEAKRFVAEYKVWEQMKKTKIKELREWEKKNTKQQE